MGLFSSFYGNAYILVVVDYVSKCYTCQLVNIEHKRPAGELKSLAVLEWKWEHITMDFVLALPRTREKFDSVWVIVDKLTKVTHFIPIKTGYTLKQWQSSVSKRK